ncbi:MAG TPA: TrbC/VirB2 family protein [Candidatus Bipolaricaulota bacterium]|nr:TrbC/VirB2 family protein [Candidatus Bipolaricaulota bacterium]
MKKILMPILILLVACPVMAALPTLVPQECLGDATECNLGSVENLMANVAGIILGLSGSIALLMFVIGGFMYIFSGGSSDTVSKAKKVLSTSVIGLALILGAGVIIKFVLSALQG